MDVKRLELARRNKVEEGPRTEDGSKLCYVLI
jgi:hypothetical protein